MQVVNVSVTVRESRESGDGWRSLELGAQAQVYPNEDWREAQRALHEALTAQLEAMGAGRDGQEAVREAQDGNGQEDSVQEESTPASPEKEVACPTHHKAKKGKYGFYCPTKLPDGSWCAWQYRS
ncbi:MAG: hypothetical protein M1370_09790 [Bacteroidetes bacterium]|nr:hypothetical protein [Bacteroidota bacterium]MCL5025119.1 hypothetical protein [Chloroflexota bacterium]